MTIGSTQDRRQFIQDKIAVMAAQAGSDRLVALREITVNVLSFSPVNDAPVTTGRNHLPDTGTVIGKLNNDYGPDYTAMHFDLSTGIKTGRINPRVTLPQIQEANAVVQQYAQEEANPLLIFTLPDDSGLQFITGNLSPGNTNRLNDILRVSTYWENQNRTAVDCLDRIGGAIARGEWPEQAFKLGLSVQPITQEFFRDYKLAYDRTVGRLAETMEKEEAEQFTQTLFNRLLFIHFISKKGWTTWNGDPDYLKALWTDYRKNQEQTNFHSDRLTVLFHEGMNTPEVQRDHATENIIGKVPFLNGGLFDRNELDLKGVHVDDEMISEIVGNEGLFSQYNFTVTEATPLDTEVAVDPEMLGKLFEETINERHDNGAYYTPRPVVSFMCREALKGYIASKDIAALDQDKVAELVDGRDPNAVTTPQALEIANAVVEMKTVDPACGSGAFLLGMLQEIITLNDTLFRAGKTHESVYQQKLDIITNNIYGADKDGLAVNTAMLRLWLSLAVEYEGEGIPDPLPNLDMKMVIGDSISGPNPQELDLTLQGISSSDLQLKIANYTTAQGEEKSALKKEIEDTKRLLRKQMGDAASSGTVEWRIEFADVMLNGGFDAVIANPPYVQLQANEGELGDLYQSNGYKTFTRSGDLYFLFYERGVDLLKQRGSLCYISSNQWMRVKSGEKLRTFFESQNPLTLINLGAGVFESAIINTCILVLSKCQNRNELRASDVRHAAEQFPPEYWTHIQPNGGETWTVLSRSGQAIKQHMDNIGMPLKDWDVNIKYGIKTGYDKAFVIDDASMGALVASNPKAEQIIRPVLKGRNINRYQAQWAGLWIINSHNGFAGVPPIQIDEYPAVKSHLDQFQERLEKRKDQGKTHYNLRSCSYCPKFDEEKIVWGNLNKEAKFAYAPKGTFITAPTVMLVPFSPYLLALLNSTLLDWYFQSIGVERDGGYYEYKPMFIERLPVPQATQEEQDPIVLIMDSIMEIKTEDPKADTSHLEQDIDKLVYELYRLNDEQITIVENEMNRGNNDG